MNSTTRSWQEILKGPALGDHIVQTYQDKEFLAEAVAEYVGTGLRAGESAVIIARAAHRTAFRQRLSDNGLDVGRLLAEGQLVLLDAEETLQGFMRGGMPDWNAFHSRVGGVIAELRLAFGTVRAYGEMVDVLWQAGQREAAIRLEEYWNDLGRLQTFSLFCAYYLDPLASASYGGALECVCKVHTHLIPARDYEALDRSVLAASRLVLAEPLTRMMLSLASSRRTSTEMPLGQAALLWLRQNMPRTAEKILAEVRSAAR